MSENKDRIAQKTIAICTVTMSFNAIEDRIVMDSLDQSKKVGWGNLTVYLTGTEANGIDFYHSSTLYFELPINRPSGHYV